MDESNMKMQEQNMKEELQDVEIKDDRASSPDCTSSIKALWSRSARLRTILGILIVDIVLYLYDVISDILVLVDLYQRSHTGLFLTTLTFVICPLVFTAFYNVMIKILADLNKSLFQLRLQDVTFKHLVESLPMLIPPLHAVYLGYLRMKNLTIYTKEHIRIKSCELFYEAGPQLVLQIYIVTTLPLTSFYIYFGSILASFLSVYIGWTQHIAIFMIDNKIQNNQNRIRGEMSVKQRHQGHIRRKPTLMEMLRCSLLFTLWDTFLFVFLLLILIPPFPLIGCIIVYSVIGCSVIINSPGKWMSFIISIEKRLVLKIVFNIVCTLLLSATLILLQEPSDNCTIGHNTCYFPKLSSRADVNVTFCPYELNATSTEINCCHNNVFSEDIVMYYIPAAFTLVGLSTLTIAIEYAYYRFYELTYIDFILIADDNDNMCFILNQLALNNIPL